jgi:lipopolysaccharide export system protein LptC
MTSSLAPELAFPTTRAERARAFDAARRHSRLVRLLRVAMPVAALVITAGFVVTVVLDARAPLTVTADAGSLGVSGAAVTMERPRLTGYSNDNRAYEVTAGRAEQSLSEPQRVDLVDLNARLQTGDAGWANIAAANGRLNSEGQVLALESAVEITTNKGDRAQLGSADVELKTGRIVSPKPVEIAVGNAGLSADSMEVLDNGDRMLFQGRVVMTLRPTSQPVTGSDAGAAEPPVR